jgi:hydroxyethylthiazole kinase-like uncharacterized protein yjeF
MKEFRLEKKSLRSGGQVAIIGGSKLFHGAPLLALKTASRIVERVFFTSPDPSIGKVAANLKSKLASFIWIPWKEVGDYIKKSDAILIGPGLMRFKRETDREKCEKNKLCDREGEKTKKMTENLLRQFPNRQWVIDAGSLQVINPQFIPKKSILTPNKKEYRLLFGQNEPGKMAKKYQCVIVAKGPETIVCSSQKCLIVRGGNEGLAKGGTGDVLAGLNVALVAKNLPFSAACIASFLIKKTADELYQKVGFVYNADDLAEKIPEVLGKYLC